MVTFGPGDPATSILTGILTGDMLHERQRSRDVISSGFPSLDALLPAGGVRRGSLIECLLAKPDCPLAKPVPRSGTAGSGTAGSGTAGSGAAGSGAAGSGGATLACAIACQLAGAIGAGGGTTGGGTIIIVDRSGWFHPPAVLPWLAASSGGARLIVARPAHDDDELWAIDQALRCPGVTAVVAWPQATQSGATQGGANAVRRQRTSVMRRWQLAARVSGAVGLIVRSAAVRGEPCWSEARIAVTPLPSVPGGQSCLLERRLHLERVGGIWCGGAADRLQAVEIVFDVSRGCESAARAGGRRQTQEVWRVAE
jgi:hypothetical protein